MIALLRRVSLTQWIIISMFAGILVGLLFPAESQHLKVISNVCTLYLAVASIFVAQAAGVHLSLGQQLMMMLTLMLTTKGIAAVPRASLVILAGTLVTFGLPLEGVMVILGVDELMDMARTTVNLVGICLASAVMARLEGELKLAPADEVKPAASS